MTVGIQGTFPKQPAEIIPVVFDMSGIFKDRTDTPTTVEVVNLGLPTSTLLVGTKLSISVGGGLDGGDYHGTAQVSTSTGMLEEIDFLVQVRETPSQVNEPADYSGAVLYSQVAQDAAQEAEAAIAQGLTYVQLSAQHALEALGAVDAVDAAAAAVEANAESAQEAAVLSQAWRDALVAQLSRSSTDLEGAHMVGWRSPLAEAVASTLGHWMGWQSISVFDFMTPEQIEAVQAYTFNMDVTVACQNAVNAAWLTARELAMPPGGYLTSGPVTVNGTSLTQNRSLRIRGSGFGNPFAAWSALRGTVIKS